jgi:Cd2+/Zn2+-exporting ATPase
MRAEPLEFKIEGMDCAEEVAVLKRELGPLVGDRDRLGFDVLNGKLTISEGPAEISPAAVMEAVARTGMRAEVWRDGPRSSDDETWFQRNGRTALTALSGTLTALGLHLHASITGSLQGAIGSEGMGLAQRTPALVQTVYGLGIVAGVWLVLPRAWLALRRVRPDMNLLMTLAVAGAVALGDWFEASTVAFLFALSLMLERWSVGHARRAVETLLDLSPPVARLLTSDGGTSEVAPDQVPVGKRFLVKPGERFPLDGRVVGGNSHTNQAPITGESMPVAKGPGDVVFAGTINGDGALEVESTKPAGATTLAHLIRMVSEAQSRRSGSEQWVERFAQVYTPAIIVLAVLVFVVPPLAVGGSWADWFYRALVLLVIGCPCALVISTPVTVVAAIAAAARQGVLIKGGLFVEIPGRVRAVAFDKTGTLTKGRPAVVGVYPLNGHTEAELLERVAALESRSEHPLAKAILAHAHERSVPIRPADDYQIIPGKGATARFNGETYWLGSHRYLEERGQETGEVHEKLEALSQGGVTVVVVGNQRHVCGYVTLADRVRANARQAVEELRALGVEKTVMLTGDNTPTATAIAEAAGVSDVRAELLPADKVNEVAGLVPKFRTVATVGDGGERRPGDGTGLAGHRNGGGGQRHGAGDGGHRPHVGRPDPHPVAGRPLPAGDAGRPVEHRRLAVDQGGVRGPHVRRVPLPVGCHRRRHGGLAAGDLQRPAAPQPGRWNVETIKVKVPVVVLE